MRRAKKEILDKEQIRHILQTAHVGRLGTMGKDGYPMIKPLNFVHDGEAIYFHGAREGEKMEDIRRHDRVCFEVDVPIRYMPATDDPCRAFYLYQSVIVRGRTTILESPEEKRRILAALMEKYQPEGGYGEFPVEKIAATAVVKISIEEITGKEDLREPEII